MNENVGTINCPGCKTEQPLRLTKNLKLYIACIEDGNLWFNTPKGQERLIKNGKLNAGVLDKIKAKPAAAPAAKPTKKPAQPAAAPKPSDSAPAPATNDDDGWLL